MPPPAGGLQARACSQPASPSLPSCPGTRDVCEQAVPWSEGEGGSCPLLSCCWLGAVPSSWQSPGTTAPSPPGSSSLRSSSAPAAEAGGFGRRGCRAGLFPCPFPWSLPLPTLKRRSVPPGGLALSSASPRSSNCLSPLVPSRQEGSLPWVGGDRNRSVPGLRQVQQLQRTSRGPVGSPRDKAELPPPQGL